MKEMKDNGRSPEREVYSFASEIASRKREIDWLWKPYIPKGKITLLTGDPGEGKSTVAADIAARLSSGRSMPFSRESVNAVNVVYQSAEDDLYDTWIPRLEMAGADFKRIAFIREDMEGLTLNDERIAYTIRKTNAALFIIDPLQAYLPAGGSLMSASKMRDLLGRISALGAREDCAILLIGHQTKSRGGKDLYRSLGTIDIPALARSVLKIERNDGGEYLRLKQVKNSLGRMADNAYFKILDGPRIEWGRRENSETEWTGHLPDDKRSRCMEFLLKILKDGPVPSKEIYRILSELGISERTANKAKADAGILARKKNSIWEWYLPEREKIIPIKRSMD